MTHFRRLLGFALVMVAAIGIAHAGGDAPPSNGNSPADLAALWPMVAMAIAGTWAYAQRKWFTAPGGWWHGAAGHVAIIAVGVVVNAVTPIVQAYHGGFHGFPWVALCWAAVGGLLNALAAANASVPMGEKPPMHPSNAGLSILLPLALLASLGLAGCGTCSTPQGAANPGCRVLDVVVNCSGADVVKGIAALVAAVTPAIIGTAIDWGALAALEKQYGTDALMCALLEAEKIAGGLSSSISGAALGALRSHSDNVKRNVAEIFAKRHVVALAAGQ